MHHQLTHVHGHTRVVTHGLLVDSDQRPELPFDFDALYYAPSTGLTFKAFDGTQQPLSPEEIAACEACCEAFLYTADYPVHAFNEAGIYAGPLLKSEAMAKGLAYRLAEAPDHPASKWDGSAWQRIVAAILDDGSVILLPERVCARCAVALSATEWAAWPTLPGVAHDEDWRWDFAFKTWRDVSDPMVYAYDEVKAFVGLHKRSALREGWSYTREAPKTPASIMTPEGWKSVAASICEDGRVEIRPEHIRDEAVLLFTREEWARWPERPPSLEGEIWVWNFRAETWRAVHARSQYQTG